MKKALDLIRAFVLEEDGVTAIEYGLLAGLIAVSIIGGATALGEGLGQFFTGIGNWFGAVTLP
ncbi:MULTISPECIES: Flp family type IVb pilin [Paraburkholderia]|uniref:Fimbrial protein n=2 Tax=Paraburkholderia TaxID=1822464 RepID=A0ABM7U384_9BURK|nr:MULTISPECIES: Flp family type IVb pilin [Paraburkholderia]TXC85505.1 Flp family type IVb pilin [Paraburkholderia azotifigens]BCZ85716.1 fimbrial protein [Paraburkholderia terrae]